MQEVLSALPVRSVNLGIGENGMHPDFRNMLTVLQAQDIKLTITSNGHSIAVLEDAELASSPKWSSRSTTRSARNRTPSACPATGT